MATSSSRQLVYTVRDEVFYALLENTDEPVEENMEDIARIGGFKLSRKEQEICSIRTENENCSGAIKVAYKTIGNRLIKYGSKKDCRQMNRNVLYDAGKRFVKYAKTGEYAFNDEVQWFGQLAKIEMPRKLKIKNQLRSINSLKKRLKEVQAKSKRVR
ncbi:hypothetical protein ACOME3_006282 [Neoechinorhynchus agilis]